MNVILEVISGAGKGEQYCIPEGTKMTFGRKAPCDKQFPRDMQMSGRHFEVDATQDRPTVRDLKSTNHTFVNQVEVREQCLYDNDRVKAGKTQFRVFLESVENPGEMLANDSHMGEQTNLGISPLNNEDTPSEQLIQTPQEGSAQKEMSDSVRVLHQALQGEPNESASLNLSEPSEESRTSGDPIADRVPESNAIDAPPFEESSPELVEGTTDDSGEIQPFKPNSDGLPADSQDNQGESAGQDLEEALGLLENQENRSVHELDTPIQTSDQDSLDQDLFGVVVEENEAECEDAHETLDPEESVVEDDDEVPLEYEMDNDALDDTDEHIVVQEVKPESAYEANPESESASNEPAPSVSAFNDSAPIEPAPIEPIELGEVGFQTQECNSQLLRMTGSFENQTHDSATIVQAIAAHYPSVLVVDFQRLCIKPPSAIYDVATPLFDWMSFEKAIECGPVAFSPNDYPEILETVNDGWDQNAILAFFGTDQSELKEQLVRLIHCDFDGNPNANAMFGYCWPQILTSLLLEKENDFVKNAFGDSVTATFLEVPGEPNSWQIFTNEPFIEQLTELGFKSSKGTHRSSVSPPAL